MIIVKYNINRFNDITIRKKITIFLCIYISTKLMCKEMIAT